MLTNDVISYEQPGQELASGFKLTCTLSGEESVVSYLLDRVNFQMIESALTGANSFL